MILAVDERADDNERVEDKPQEICNDKRRLFVHDSIDNPRYIENRVRRSCCDRNAGGVSVRVYLEELRERHERSHDSGRIYDCIKEAF